MTAPAGATRPVVTAGTTGTVCGTSAAKRAASNSDRPQNRAGGDRSNDRDRPRYQAGGDRRDERDRRDDRDRPRYRPVVTAGTTGTVVATGTARGTSAAKRAASNRIVHRTGPAVTAPTIGTGRGSSPAADRRDARGRDPRGGSRRDERPASRPAQ